jgi:hypothetical protein
VQYEINVEQLDEHGEVADGFTLRLRVGADALARVLPGLLAESMGAESVSVVTGTAAPESATSSDKPTRTRRTKAQIEADKAAEAARLAAGGPPMPQAPATDAPTSPLPAGVPSPLAAPLPAAGVAPAAPYDPFAAKS